MVVGHQPPGLVGGHQRYPRGLNESLQPSPVAPVSRRRGGYYQGPTGGVKDLHRLRYLSFACSRLSLKAVGG